MNCAYWLYVNAVADMKTQLLFNKEFAAQLVLFAAETVIIHFLGSACRGLDAESTPQ